VPGRLEKAMTCHERVEQIGGFLKPLAMPVDYYLAFVHNVDTLWTNFLKKRISAAFRRENTRSVHKVTDFVDRHYLVITGRYFMFKLSSILSKEEIKTVMVILDVFRQHHDDPEMRTGVAEILLKVPVDADFSTTDIARIGAIFSMARKTSSDQGDIHTFGEIMIKLASVMETETSSISQQLNAESGDFSKYSVAPQDINTTKEKNRKPTKLSQTLYYITCGIHIVLTIIIMLLLLEETSYISGSFCMFAIIGNIVSLAGCILLLMRKYIGILLIMTGSILCIVFSVLSGIFYRNDQFYIDEFITFLIFTIIPGLILLPQVLIILRKNRYNI
jgi:hypothetical protein